MKCIQNLQLQNSQGYSRRNRVPVDVLGYEFHVMDTDDPHEFEDQYHEEQEEREAHRAEYGDPSSEEEGIAGVAGMGGGHDDGELQGIVIYGIFFDGCKWDYESQTLGDQDYGVMYCTCPLINLIPCKDYKPNPEQYSCPFYKTSVRAGTLSTTGHSTNFVMLIELDSIEVPSYWILKGAAMLSMLND